MKLIAIILSALIIAVLTGMFIAHQRVAAIVAPKTAAIAATESKEVDTTLEAVKLAGVARDEAAAYAKVKAALEEKGVHTGLVLVSVNGKDEWLPQDWMAQSLAKVQAQGERVKLEGELNGAKAMLKTYQDSAERLAGFTPSTYAGGDDPATAAARKAQNDAYAKQVQADAKWTPEAWTADGSVSFDYRWQISEKAPVIPDLAGVGDRLALMDVLVEHFNMNRETLNLPEIKYRDLIDIYWSRVKASGQPPPYPARGPAKAVAGGTAMP